MSCGQHGQRDEDARWDGNEGLVVDGGEEGSEVGWGVGANDGLTEASVESFIAPGAGYAVGKGKGCVGTRLACGEDTEGGSRYGVGLYGAREISMIRHIGLRRRWGLELG